MAGITLALDHLFSSETPQAPLLVHDGTKMLFELPAITCVSQSDHPAICCRCEALGNTQFVT